MHIQLSDNLISFQCRESATSAVLKSKLECLSKDGKVCKAPHKEVISLYCTHDLCIDLFLIRHRRFWPRALKHAHGDGILRRELAIESGLEIAMSPQTFFDETCATRLCK